jgi:hypothetical protein
MSDKLQLVVSLNIQNDKLKFVGQKLETQNLD